ncbi:cryptochrome/photolyase family protein [Acidimangrovimonas sediminis]|uniref:cryptochrome/photolyase family protein n=1 Tax=Acidimangrovimonas sediminis TaxID=2056283 RepID=UPI000C800976
MKALRIVLGDQLSRDISALDGIEAGDVVLMMEVAEETTYVGHHKQKLVLFLAAMRHFAEELRDKGHEVDYIRLTDAGNTGDFTGEVKRAVARHKPDQLVGTEPGEWRVARAMEGWDKVLDVEVEIRPDTRFFASHQRFADWARGRKSWRMEHFYREMRRETGLLMQGDEPAGGDWNYDGDNRKPWPRRKPVPHRRRFRPDDITREVIDLVADRFPDNIGGLDHFDWPVTRHEALAALRDFIETALPGFGDYQDAMKTGAPFLNHSLLSPALNLGLLSPREVCARAEQAWQDGHAPLNAVEGFIRQILGWREYVRGVYWAKMPGYAAADALDADRPLPAFYWTGKTDMACLAHVIGDTIDHAYSHHIQRLMITGNFALLAGIRPREIERWYLEVYADALEWVEMPNTLGMAVFADGGLMASKPYAASGSYISKMSDFCTGCSYDVKKKTGEGACPFNALYWAFLDRNRKHLKGNPRLAMPYRTLDGWDADRREGYAAAARHFLDGLD